MQGTHKHEVDRMEVPHRNAVSINKSTAVIVNTGTDDDKGGGLVGIPITTHPFEVGEEVIIANTVNYDGTYTIISETTNEIVITATYVGETFGADDTCDATDQDISTEPSMAVYVGGTGDLKVDMVGGQTAVLFESVPAGFILPIAVTKVYSTANGSTATEVIIMY